MKLYQNVMESFVEEELDRMGDSLGCCLCEQCRNDVAAYALNHVPSRYVVTKSGGIISKGRTDNSCSGQSCQSSLYILGMV